MFTGIPTLDEIGVNKIPVAHQKRKILSGETIALKQMTLRLKAEENAFLAGLYRPSQARPDILGPSLSLSAGNTEQSHMLRNFSIFY